MADLTINALKKAPILDANGATLGTGYTATSDAAAIAKVTAPGGTNGTAWTVTGVSAGVAGITVQRNLDGVSVTHSVEVIGADPFDWHLGTEVAA